MLVVKVGRLRCTAHYCPKSNVAQVHAADTEGSMGSRPLTSLWHTENEIFQIHMLDELILTWLIIQLIGFDCI